MIETVFGTKISSTRYFIQDGSQIPITKVLAKMVTVIRIKTKAKDGYDALQLGIGSRKLKSAKKPLLGQLKNLKLAQPPGYLREVRTNDPTSFQSGQLISPAQVLVAGDLVDVSGRSKGKGFAGVVKRWHFAGGPRTHGQSDRERSPGSIGQTTTPGRVYKGKKMAGRMGGEKITIRNLTVLDYDQENNLLLLSGLVPGGRNGLLSIKKVGHQKDFISLLKSGEVISFEKQEASAAEAKEKKAAKPEKDQLKKNDLPNQQPAVKENKPA